MNLAEFEGKLNPVSWIAKHMHMAIRSSFMLRLKEKIMLRSMGSKVRAVCIESAHVGADDNMSVGRMTT